MRALCDQDISIENFSYKGKNSKGTYQVWPQFCKLHLLSRKLYVRTSFVFSCSGEKAHLLKGLFYCSLAAEYSVLARSVTAMALRRYVFCSQRQCHLARVKAKKRREDKSLLNWFVVDLKLYQFCCSYLQIPVVSAAEKCGGSMPLTE